MKILIVEDHPIVVSGCRALLTEEEDNTVLEARTAAHGLQLFQSCKPDVSVVDINLPDQSGFELTREMLALDREARIVIFTMNDAPMLAAQAVKCGAKGYVSKNDDPSKLGEAIRAVAVGEVWMPIEVTQSIAFSRLGSSVRGPVLTEREIAVLRLLARGKSMSEIATMINVSYKTIANTCSALRRKLKARTPMEMVRIAMEGRII